MSMPELTIEQVREGAGIVHRHMPPTPAYHWPLLSARAGCEVWVKHENHTPTGAFKVRGGLVYLTKLKESEPDCPGVISATRGNHGQSVARAASAVGMKSVIVVPHGNNPEKNAAMKAFGAELIEHGEDFQEALEFTIELAKERGLHLVPVFHPWLLMGVSSYALELFEEHPDLDTVYVPIGMGSGICSLITVRDLLGLDTKMVGIVAENAPAYALSFEAGKPVNTNTADTIADGVACRAPDARAVKIICEGAERIVRIEEDEFKDAMAAYFVDTHNAAESAGAGPLAGLLKEKGTMAGKKVGVILSGGNSDAQLFREVLGRGLE
jgi:threonine dehydratase